MNKTQLKDIISTVVEMSASKNPDSMTPAQGEFSSKVAPSKPLTTKGVLTSPSPPSKKPFLTNFHSTLPA